MVVKYFFIGGVAAAIDLVLFWLFADVLQYKYLLVGVFTFIVSTGANYLLAARFVFVSGIRFERHKEVFLVYLISAIGLAVNLAVLYITYDLFEIHLMMSKIIASGAVFVWNYSARVKFVY